MRRLLRAIGLVLAGIVTLVVAAYVAIGLSGMAQVSDAKKQAVAELDSALAKTEASAAAEHDRLLAAEAPDPAYSWREVVCELTTNDAGWMVDDYVQECSLRSVRLTPAHDVAGTCDLLDTRFVEGSPSTSVVAWRGPGPELEADSHVPGCPSGLTAPGPGDVSRILEGTRPSNLSSSASWVMVEARTPLSETILGCDPWAVIFCSSPVDAPVLEG